LPAVNYTYGPHGECSPTTGTFSEVNPQQSASYRPAATTDFHYYGLRYYSPTQGRWPSRDLIKEKGGVNLYGMVYNDPLNQVDGLGLAPGKANKCDCDALKAKYARELNFKPLNELNSYDVADKFSLMEAIRAAQVQLVTTGATDAMEFATAVGGSPSEGYFVTDFKTDGDPYSVGADRLDSMRQAFPESEGGIAIGLHTHISAPGSVNEKFSPSDLIRTGRSVALVITPSFQTRAYRPKVDPKPPLPLTDSFLRNGSYLGTPIDGGVPPEDLEGLMNCKKANLL